MSHELTFNTKTGTSTMARRRGSAEAWHEDETFKPGLFDESDDLDTLIQKASFDFDLVKYPLFAKLPEFADIDDRVAIYRQDYDGSNKRFIEVKSGIYKPVQPKTIMSWFKNQADRNGLILETAGVLQDGRTYWACGTNGVNADVGNGDNIGLYVTMATGMDRATDYFMTTVRTVCANTLRLADNSKQGPRGRQTHRGEFNPDKASFELQMDVAVQEFNELVDQSKELTKIHPNKKHALEYLRAVWGDVTKPVDEQSDVAARHMTECFKLYDGQGKGASLDSSRDTAWGLVNSVTEYVDHIQRAHNPENRFNRAFFGPGSASKRAAFELACELGKGAQWLEATEAYNANVMRIRAGQAVEPIVKPVQYADESSLFASLLNR